MSAPVRELTGAQYPPRLRDLPEPPPAVWLAGELPRMPSIALVGTREATEPGCAFARSLAADLARAGLAVFSGGAHGIDTAAHEGALDAGGVTVVVAPSSFDRPAPKTNAGLFRRIVRSGGAHITRFPPGTVARPWHYFPRNAMLVALADAVVVVQSGIIGGARNAALHARRLRRPLLVVPGAPWEEKGIGCVLELRLGATPVGSARDILESIGRRVGPPVVGPGRQPIDRPQLAIDHSQVADTPSYPPADPELASVWTTLRERPSDLDELHVRTGIPVGRLRGLLLTLTLDGVLVSSPSGQLSLTK